MAHDIKKPRGSKANQPGRGTDKLYSLGNEGQSGNRGKDRDGQRAGEFGKERTKRSGNHLSRRNEGKQERQPGGGHEGKEGGKKGHFKKRVNSAYGIRTAASAEEVTIGERIIVTVKRIGINGEGVGYYKRKAVFIEGALPGEVVRASVTKVEPGFLMATIVELERRSPDRQEPRCPVYSACGGCQLQHMTYSAQLAAKEELVREAFQRYAGLQELPMHPIIGMDDPWGYRNKAQLQTGYEGKDIIAGLYAAGTHRLVDISGCGVQHPVINEVIEKVKSILTELHISVYNERTREGAVRTIVARIAKSTGDIQLTLITAVDRLPDSRRLIQRIREALPIVRTIAQNVNKGKSSLIFGEKTIVLWGQERLSETLGEVKFALSPRAFFQLNPEQTVKLYNKVEEAASLSGEELIVDAYCGTGTIGLWLAPHAREVRGIEVIPEAVQDARDNARESGVTNAQFYEGRAEKLLPEWIGRGIRPDVIVVDPPRTGCERPLLEAVVQAKPKRLVYVSCNPSTLAKDCKYLLEHGFRLESVQPVDMFPQTSHVESVILMVRK
ncbi:23S rRNA (uracil(1939)-C(5))-methyltransferase RlmD [Paenibacillus sp. GCM10012307]|uniref:23S rRNA (Uracil(1939)-C(5))-methyltransferase RlmD n=1 Tax=Paenibacillus roseus TaxID=2798579 RepID=A0A934MTS3_9BACL|nr:23S rRNA (uracil(1939)-C(5))-methyltransferase RlmD [Paenibacillus roseus]MBJ6360357.1 23S rRNA (uracil(1939)-C(5))-methyltransferase RlmD [Paenibacillus roseus]